jgi:hypothetical protein
MKKGMHATPSLHSKAVPTPSRSQKITRQSIARRTNVSLATYTIVVRRRYNKEAEPIGQFEGADLLDFVREYLTNRKSPLNDKEKHHILRAEIHSDKNRQISGLIETGEYGYSSELFDTSKEKTAYRRKPTDADLLPFVFLFDLPKDEKNGIIILQRFKTYGIRKVFADDFSAFFSSRFPNSIVEIQPIVPKALLEKFTKESSATKIRFRKLHIPQDICDALANGITPKDGYVEYSIIAKKGGRFKGMFTKKDNAQLLAVSSEAGFTPDRTLVEVNVNGKKRTLDIADLNRLRAYFEITDEVQFGIDGHPTYESVLQASNDLLADLWTVSKGTHNV